MSENIAASFNVEEGNLPHKSAFFVLVNAKMRHDSVETVIVDLGLFYVIV